MLEAKLVAEPPAADPLTGGLTVVACQLPNDLRSNDLLPVKHQNLIGLLTVEADAFGSNRISLAVTGHND
jgi:hypothetical protein